MKQLFDANPEVTVSGTDKLTGEVIELTTAQMKKISQGKYTGAKSEISRAQVNPPAGTPAASPPPTPPEYAGVELQGFETPSSGGSSGTTSRSSNISLESQPTGRDLMSRLRNADYTPTARTDPLELGGTPSRGGRLPTSEPSSGTRTPMESQGYKPLNTFEIETVDLAPSRPAPKPAPKPPPKGTIKPPKPKTGAKTIFGGSNIQGGRPVMDVNVSSQFTNTTSSKLSSSLRALSSKVPTLQRPSLATIKSVGGQVGGTAAGIGIGIGVSYLMAQYFKAHPATDKYSQYGQQFAVGFSGAVAGSLFMKALEIAGKMGVKMFTTKAGAKLVLREAAAATGEAAALVGIQMATEIGIEALMDRYKFSHAASKVAAAGVSGAEGEIYGAMRGGPFGLVLMTAFAVYGVIDAYIQGTEEDRAEYETRQATAQTTRDVNYARRALIVNMSKTNNDYDAAYAMLSPEDKQKLGLVGEASANEFKNSLTLEFDPLAKSRNPRQLTEVEEQKVDYTVPLEMAALGYVMGPFGWVLGSSLAAYDVAFQKQQIEEDKIKTKFYQDYVEWYMKKLEDPKYNVPAPSGEGADLLDRDTMGSWRSSAELSGTLAYQENVNYTRIVNNARNTILQQWTDNNTTMDDLRANDAFKDVIDTANLDEKFAEDYDNYIVTDAAVQLTYMFNQEGINYRDADPKLVAIAGRSSSTLPALDKYYEIMTDLAKDSGLTIAELARLNALPEKDQQHEFGKINAIREKIIRGEINKTKESVDAYNANIVHELGMYGSNIEEIMRNINDYEMLQGHSYLYAMNRADLFKQLLLEAPVIENPTNVYAEVTDFDYNKNRTDGDTRIYGYNYNLVDVQMKELNEWTTKNNPTNQQRIDRAKFIYDRDHSYYFKTDAEIAAEYNMTLDEFYAEYGKDKGPIPPNYTEASQIKRENDITMYMSAFGIERDAAERMYTQNEKAKENKYRRPEEEVVMQQGNITMPDGSIRTYVDGAVVSVKYPDGVKGLTPKEINDAEGKKKDPNFKTFEEKQADLLAESDRQAALTKNNNERINDYKAMYPEEVRRATLAHAHKSNGDELILAQLDAYYIKDKADQAAGIERPAPEREPTYDELKIMYPKEYRSYYRLLSPTNPERESVTEEWLKLVHTNEQKPLPNQEVEATTPDEIRQAPEEMRQTPEQQQNDLNQRRANDAAGISNVNNEPENP